MTDTPRPDAVALLAARRALRDDALLHGAKARAAAHASREDARNAAAFAKLDVPTPGRRRPPGAPGAPVPPSIALPSRAESRGRLAGYWAVTGPPPSCGGGDAGRDAARVFHRKVLAAIERGGWTRQERGALYKLGRVWHARAYGHDDRFAQVGNRRGRLPAEDETAIAESRTARARAALEQLKPRRRR